MTNLVKQLSHRNRVCKTGFAFLLSLFLIPTVRAVEVCVVSDPDNEMVAFAVGDIEKSLAVQGHTVVRASSSSQVPQKTDLQVVLRVRDTATRDEPFGVASLRLPNDPQPEGFAIRLVRKKGRRTYWVLGSDSAGVMYGGLEIAGIVSANGLDAIKEIYNGLGLELVHDQMLSNVETLHTMTPIAKSCSFTDSTIPRSRRCWTASSH